MSNNDGIVQSMVASWSNLARGIVLIASIFLGFYLVFNKALKSDNLNVHVAGTSIEIGEKGILKNFLVSPREWTYTGIDVIAGDKLYIEATGSINIAMGNMIKSLHNFVQIASTKKDMNVGLFDENEVKESTLPFPWNSPEGLNLEDISDANVINRIKTQKQKLLYNGGKVGQLLIYNYEESHVPNLERIGKDKEIFTFHGNPTVLTIKKSGTLYFGINDVVLENSKSAVLNWQDNVGFFAVNVKLIRND